MTMLPAAFASALTEPGCFVDSHRTTPGVWLHRAVYTGHDAPPAVDLGHTGPGDTYERMYRQQAMSNRALRAALEVIASGVSGDEARQIAKDTLR